MIGDLENSYKLSSVSDAISYFNKLKAEYSEEELDNATLFVGSTFATIPNQTLNVSLPSGGHVAFLTIAPHYKL